MFWHQLWTTAALASYRVDLCELMIAHFVDKVSWLLIVKNLLAKLGLGAHWRDPETLNQINKLSLKAVYWVFIETDQILNCKGSLSNDFMIIKQILHFEPTLDEIEPPLARKLYLQFRYGCLPLNYFKRNWCKAGESAEEYCPCRQGISETPEHVLFFCPMYSRSRLKWIAPLCRNLGVRRYMEAFRILKTNTTRLIVFCIAKFLMVVWIRRTKFSPNSL